MAPLRGDLLCHCYLVLVSQVKKANALTDVCQIIKDTEAKPTLLSLPPLHSFPEVETNKALPHTHPSPRTPFQ